MVYGVPNHKRLSVQQVSQPAVRNDIVQTIYGVIAPRGAVRKPLKTIKPHEKSFLEVFFNQGPTSRVRLQSHPKSKGEGTV